MLDYLNCKHEKLHWKTDKEWAEYQGTQNIRVNAFHRAGICKPWGRKRYEGMFEEMFYIVHVEEQESWFKWGEENTESIGTATITGKVKTLQQPCKWDAMRYLMENDKSSGENLILTIHSYN